MNNALMRSMFAIVAFSFLVSNMQVVAGKRNEAGKDIIIDNGGASEQQIFAIAKVLHRVKKLKHLLLDIREKDLKSIRSAVLNAKKEVLSKLNDIADVADNSQQIEELSFKVAAIEVAIAGLADMLALVLENQDTIKENQDIIQSSLGSSSQPSLDPQQITSIEELDKAPISVAQLAKSTYRQVRADDFVS
jgi:hypothetical protein